MTVDEVKKIMAGSGALPSSYAINDSRKQLADAAVVLECRDGLFHFYIEEQGQVAEMHVYGSESEACEGFLDEMQRSCPKLRGMRQGMTMADAREILESCGVWKALYSLNEHKPLAEVAYVITHKPGTSLYKYHIQERGEPIETHWFDSESEACLALLNDMAFDRPKIKEYLRKNGLIH